jgi:hypothetical protein
VDELSQLLCAAILSSLHERPVTGYALVVDADMTSVYGASLGHRDAELDNLLMFSPVDWAEEHHSREFGRASQRLSEVGEAPYELRVAKLAAAMTTALQRARVLDDALAHALLLVCCADGGGLWDNVEDEIAAKLNEPAAYARWRGARGL